MANIEQEMPAAAGGIPLEALNDFIRREFIPVYAPDRIVFDVRAPEEFIKHEEWFRQLPFGGTPPATFQEWWKATTLYRQEWQKELEWGVYSSSSHFYLANCSPGDLRGDTEFIGCVFWLLASRDIEGVVRFSENVVTGWVSCGKMYNPTRHNFSDLVNAQPKLVA